MEHKATGVNSKFLDKAELRKIIAEQNAKMGFVPDTTATAEKSQQLMRALGIRPEDNIGSSGIISARDESAPGGRLYFPAGCFQHPV